jgi:hypothetical protein
MTATGGQGGTGGSMTGGTGGTGSCVEPTPEGWAGPFQPYGPNINENGAITVLPDESGGLAGIGPRVGPFACPHDFVRVGVDYRTAPLFGYEFSRPAAVRLDFVMGDADGNPSSAPVFAEATCYTDGTLPACGPLAVEGDYTMTEIDVAPVHVEPGDVIYPTMQVDTEVGASVSEILSPNPGWYYAPPGSGAGGPNGTWAPLDDPPPGVLAYPFAPVIRLYE